jgi:hypothetical protein
MERGKAKERAISQSQLERIRAREEELFNKKVTNIASK